MNNIYDAEFHPLIYSPAQETNCRRWFNFFAYLVVLLTIIAFMITDFIYGYSYTKCIGETLDPMPISLSTWFMFSGWFGVLIIIFAIGFGCCWTVQPTIQLIVTLIPQIIMFSWLLIGNVIYWRDYYDNNNCENGIINYLLIRFYVGFLLIIGAVYHEIKTHG